MTEQNFFAELTLRESTVDYQPPAEMTLAELIGVRTKLNVSVSFRSTFQGQGESKIAAWAFGFDLPCSQGEIANL